MHHTYAVAYMLIKKMIFIDSSYGMATSTSKSRRAKKGAETKIKTEGNIMTYTVRAI